MRNYSEHLMLSIFERSNPACCIVWMFVARRYHLLEVNKFQIQFAMKLCTFITFETSRFPANWCIVKVQRNILTLDRTIMFSSLTGICMCVCGFSRIFYKKYLFIHPHTGEKITEIVVQIWWICLSCFLSSSGTRSLQHLSQLQLLYANIVIFDLRFA